MEQSIEPLNFKAFVNDFANNIYPAYEDASSSGNIKAHKVQMRLRVMFLAMCEYFAFNPENILLPFSTNIPLHLPADNVEDVLDESFGTYIEDDSESVGHFSAGADDKENAELLESSSSSDEPLDAVGEILTEVVESEEHNGEES